MLINSWKGFFSTGSSFFGFMTTNEDILLINESLKPILIVLPLVSIWPFMFDGIFIGCTESKPMRNSTMLALFSFIVLIYFFVYDDQNIRILWICFLIYLFPRFLATNLIRVNSPLRT